MSYKIDGKFTSDSVNGIALGLFGDGIHDDSDVLNSILSQNKRIYLPSGTYLISKTINIPAGVELYGDGFTTIIKLASSYTLTGVSWRTSYKYPYLLLGNNATLKNLMVNGDESAFADQGHVGIMAYGNNILIEKVKTNNVNYFPNDWIGGEQGYGTVNAPGYGIQIFNSSNVTVRDCVTNGNGYEGIGVESSDKVTIENCKIGDGNRTGLQIHRGSKRVVVMGCVIDNHCVNKTTDITIHGDNTDSDYIEDLNIIGCNCLYPSNGLYGIQTVTGYEKNVVIESCEIAANSVGIITANVMEETVQNSKDFIVNGNIIRSDEAGIEIRGDRCVVCDNIIHYSTNAISVTGNNKVISNNLTIQETNS